MDFNYCSFPSILKAEEWKISHTSKRIRISYGWKDFADGFCGIVQSGIWRNNLRPLVAGEWNYSAADILRMFMYADIDRNETALQPNTLRRLLRERFTRRLHDAMVRELAALLPRSEQSWEKIINKPIHYTELEQNYIDNIDGYRFLLPSGTDELWGYGEVFHNCVVSYCVDVVKKRSLILAMKRGNKYVACIEVQQRRVVQALGPCNQKLPAEVREVLRKWADKKKIGYRP